MNKNKSMLLRFNDVNQATLDKFRLLFNLKSSDNVGVFKRIFALFNPIIDYIDRTDLIEIMIKDESNNKKKSIQTSVSVLCEMPSENVDMSVVNKIVEKIIDDMSDRRGLRQEWESIDDDVKREMEETWKTIVRKVLSEKALNND